MVLCIFPEGGIIKNLSESHSRRVMAQQSRSERTKPKDPPQEEVTPTTEERSLPILPVRDTVLFPHAVLPLTVGRESSVQLINSLGEDKTIVVVAQREARVTTGGFARGYSAAPVGGWTPCERKELQRLGSGGSFSSVR